MKQTLNDGHVLSVATECKVNEPKNNRMLSNGEWGVITGELNKNEQENIVHALTVAGYDDNIYYGINGNGTIESFERGAFLIANSWGTDAAGHNNGFIWVIYDAFNQKSDFADLYGVDIKKYVYVKRGRFYYEKKINEGERKLAVLVKCNADNDIVIFFSRNCVWSGKTGVALWRKYSC